MKKDMYHIALVDEDQQFLKEMAFHLENEYKVSTFTSSAEALLNINNNIDILILDGKKSRDKNLALSQYFKTIDPYLPVLFLSGQDTLKLRMNSFSRSIYKIFSSANPRTSLKII